MAKAKWREVMERDQKWYKDNLDELKKLYDQKWIAISDCRVVESDDTEAGLLEKVRNLKSASIYIRQVDAPLPVYNFRSPRRIIR